LGIRQGAVAHTEFDYMQSQIISTKWLEIENTIAPGTSVVERFRGQCLDMNGRLVSNLATSYYGVMNEFDKEIVKILQTLTIRYLQNYPNPPTSPEDLSRILIPIWLEDIAMDLGQSRGPNIIDSLNRSIIRINHTQIRLSDQSIHDQFNDFGLGDSHIRMLSACHIIRPNTATDANALMTEEQNIPLRDRHATDYQYQFKTVAISWDVEFYTALLGKILNDDSEYAELDGPTANNRPDFKYLTVQAPDLLKLPLIFKTLQSFFRADFYARRPRLLVNGRADTTTKQFIVEKWSYLSPDDIISMNKDLISALKLVTGINQRRVSKDNRVLFAKLVEEKKHFDDNSYFAKINLFGVIISLYVPRIDNPAALENLNSKLTVEINARQIVEDSGALFRPNRNNKPVMPNPLHRANRDQVRLVDRRIPREISEIITNLPNYREQKYYVSYSLAGNEVLFSYYTNPMTVLEKVRATCEVLGYDDMQAELQTFFAHRKLKLDPLPNIDQDLFEELRHISGLSSYDIVKMLASRVQFYNRTGGDKQIILNLLKSASAQSKRLSAR
jgi:hypothetical protein